MNDDELLYFLGQCLVTVYITVCLVFKNYYSDTLLCVLDEKCFVLLDRLAILLMDDDGVIIHSYVERMTI